MNDTKEGYRMQKNNTVTLQLLKRRQKSMGIPYEIIAQRAHIGSSTVKRFFTGGNSSFSSIEKIASVLECNINISIDKEGDILLEEQIEKKALIAVKRVMKTSALELQNPDNKAYRAMVEKAKKQIRKMPRSHIWS